MKGKIVLVNFWATWCGGCQIEIPWFRDFHSRYKKAGLETIGVSLDSDGWTSVRPYLKKKPIAYTIVIGNEGIAKEFKVTAMPVTILIDRQGRAAASSIGVPAKATYQAEIESLLKCSTEPFKVVVSQRCSPGDGLDFGCIQLSSREEYDVRTILLIVLILLLLGALPTWPYSTGWGYYPSGGLGLVLLIVMILVLAKRI